MEICNNICLQNLINDFITQSFEEKNFSYKKYNKQYKNLQIKASFGKGNKAYITWLAFLGYGQEVQKGIYPVILFDWQKKFLIVSYGVSATNAPNINWSNTKESQKIKNITEKDINLLFNKYKTSYVKKIFYLDKLDIKSIIAEIIRSLNKVIEEYQNIFSKNKVILKKNNQSQEENRMNNTKKIPLNQILFGPPGTGKTYKTIELALEIIAQKDEILKNFLQNDYSREELKEKFDEYKHKGQIEFITFHQSYSYEEFIEGIKAEIKENGNINYEIKDGIFKKLAKNAKENYENSQKSKVLNIEELLQDFTDYVNNQNNFILKDDATISQINFDTDNNFKSFKTGGSVVGQSLTKEVIIRDFEKFLNNEIKTPDDIKPSRESNQKRHGNAIYYFALYEKLKDFMDKQKQNEILYYENTEPLKNFVLIIDEINRGNISKIFGELITLIEKSKRIGEKEELKIKLPYSKDEFGVPNNLYIIGTMNTADRSIAPIDTALRRRFEFVEMMPEYDLLSTDIKGINIQEILKAINARIEVIYDRDHQIGHSYLLDIKDLEDLKDRFKNKILPLLAEYFYEDWENIKLILNDNGMVREKKDNNKYLQNIENRQKIYEITNSNDWNEENKKIFFEKIYKTNDNNNN